MRRSGEGSSTERHRNPTMANNQRAFILLSASLLPIVFHPPASLGQSVTHAAHFSLGIEAALAAAPTRPPLDDLYTSGIPERPAGSDLPALPLRLGLDVMDGIREPFHWKKKQWAKLGLGVLAIGTVSLFDDEIRDLVGGGSVDGSSQVASTLRPLGRAPGLAIIASTWLAGKVSGRAGLQRVSSDALEASLLSGLATATLKRVAGRARPRHGYGSTAWQTGEESFPSGEVTSAFALAAVFARHSNKVWIDTLAWSYAGLMAWQRMKLDAHWASDTLGGALIGVVVGRWIVSRNGPWLGDRLSLSPAVRKGEWGVAGSYRFGQ